MKKYIYAVAALLIIGVAAFLIMGPDDAGDWPSPPAAANNGSSESTNSDTTDEEDYTYEIDEPEDNEENQQFIDVDIDFELYKAQERIAYSELDEIEEIAVGFTDGLFNSPGSETDSELLNRLEQYLFEGTTNIRNLIDIEQYLTEEKRTLQAVYLLPEYLEEDVIYVVPMKLHYKIGNKEEDAVMHLGIAKKEEGGIKGVIGHAEGREWFVREMQEKYDL